MPFVSVGRRVAPLLWRLGRQQRSPLASSYRRAALSSTTSTSTTGGDGSSNSSSTNTSSSSSSSSSPFQGKSRAELAKFHKYIRTAQVAEALRQGFQDGHLPARCTGSLNSSSSGAGGAGGGDGSGDVEAALRASRARPSLLVPLAGSVGFGLRCLTQLVPGTAPVAKGVLGSIEAAMDDGVRALIQMEQQQEGAAATAAAVKGLLKARRDGVAAAAGGEGGEGEAVGVGGNPLAQGTQLVCRALLKGAEKL